MAEEKVVAVRHRIQLLDEEVELLHYILLPCIKMGNINLDPAITPSEKLEDIRDFLDRNKNKVRKLND